MSFIRKVDMDQSMTRELLAKLADGQIHPYDADDARGRSWLGHTKGARLLDIQLLQPSTMDELMAHSGRTEPGVISHFYHLRDEHGLEVVENNGRYRLHVAHAQQLGAYIYRMIRLQ